MVTTPSWEPPTPASVTLTALATRARQRGQGIVVVQGLGFVGTAVAATIAGSCDESGGPRYLVIGVDLASPTGQQKVAQLNNGQPPFHAPDPQLSALIATAVHHHGNLVATTDEAAYGLADVIVVDVQIDVLNRAETDPAAIAVDLAGFETAIRQVGRQMRHDALILIETTVPVGTCEKVVLPLLREELHRRGFDGPVALAHAYERVMPGPRYIDSIRRFWRVYAGLDAPASERARDFLASFIEVGAFPLVQLENSTASELAKLLENSYRAVNIALIHEWTLLAEQIGVNLFSVVDAIRRRAGTHDNIRNPGFGVGGYCLTKDSLLAEWGASNLFGVESRLELTLTSLRVNHEMPLHTLGLLAEVLDGSLAGRVVVVCGVAYLPGVPDTRHSPAELFVDRLLAAGAQVRVHDPMVRHWPERPHIVVANDLAACLHGADAMVLAVAHPEYFQVPTDILAVAGRKPAIVDAQNIVNDVDAAALAAASCRIIGVGKGHWRRRGYHVPK